MVFGPLLWPSCDFKFIFGLKEDSGLVQGVIKDLLCFHMQKLQLFLRASADGPSKSMDHNWSYLPCLVKNSHLEAREALEHWLLRL